MTEWPLDRHGFRLRGMDMTRTEAFTDAAFAFVVTLLVIAGERVPGSYEELVQALKGIGAFAVSFLLIMTFWYGHWKWSRRFGLEDLPSIMLSGTLVFAVLIYVYPLKFLYSITMFYFSGGRIATGASIQSLDQLYELFAIYGTGFVAMNVIIAALNVHAYRQRDALQLNALEQHITQAEIWSWLLVGAVGALSVLVALFTTPSAAVLPGWTYMLLPVIMPLHGARMNRRGQQLSVAVSAANARAHS